MTTDVRNAAAPAAAMFLPMECFYTMKIGDAS
jgi:hypothetical protein